MDLEEIKEALEALEKVRETHDPEVLRAALQRLEGASHLIAEELQGRDDGA